MLTLKWSPLDNKVKGNSNSLDRQTDKQTLGQLAGGLGLFQTGQRHGRPVTLRHGEMKEVWEEKGTAESERNEVKSQAGGHGKRQCSTKQGWFVDYDFAQLSHLSV